MYSVLKLCNKTNLQEYRKWKVEIETFVGKTSIKKKSTPLYILQVLLKTLFNSKYF